MNHLQLFENFAPSVAYHVTFSHLMPAIKEQGLLPHMPDDMDDDEVVYLFKTRDDAEEAVMNWFGDRIEEMEEEMGEEVETVLLTINISGLDLIDSTGYEWTCLVPIEPARIVSTELI